MKKHDMSYVRDCFEKHGCKLMENDYPGNRIKMRFICSCGKEYAKTFDSFCKHPNCRACGRTKAITKISHPHWYVEQYFLDHDCRLLTPYMDSTSHVRYVCQCGRESEITFDNFRRGKRCRQCGFAKIRGSGHGRWREDRDKKKLDDLFRKKCYKALAKTLQAVGKDKVGHTTDLLGYSPVQLQEHITKHKNWSRVKNERWHLDHIFPIQAFMENGIDDISLINNLDNLRPVSQSHNLSKGHKYNPSKFEKWLVEHGCTNKVSARKQET